MGRILQFSDVHFGCEHKDACAAALDYAHATPNDLVLISPMISKAMEDPIGLEAAAMDPSDATQAFRLAANALFSDWRHDPAVSTRPAKLIEVRARSKIPAVIDGEPLLLKPDAVIRFVPKAFKALAPRPPSAEDSL